MVGRMQGFVVSGIQGRGKGKGNTQLLDAHNRSSENV